MDEIDGLPPKIERDAEFRGRIAGLKEAAEIILDVAKRQREYGLDAKADQLAVVYVPIQQRIASLSPRPTQD